MLSSRGRISPETRLLRGQPAHPHVLLLRGCCNCYDPQTLQVCIYAYYLFSYGTHRHERLLSLSCSYWADNETLNPAWSAATVEINPMLSESYRRTLLVQLGQTSAGSIKLLCSRNSKNSHGSVATKNWSVRLNASKFFLDY